MGMRVVLGLALVWGLIGCASTEPAAPPPSSSASASTGDESVEAATPDEPPVPSSCPDLEVGHANGTLEVQIEALGLHSMIPGGATRRQEREGHIYSITGSQYGTIEVSFEAQEAFAVDEAFAAQVASEMANDADTTNVQTTVIARQWQGIEVSGLETTFEIEGAAVASWFAVLPVGDAVVVLAVTAPAQRQEELDATFATLLETTTTECLAAP